MSRKDIQVVRKWRAKPEFKPQDLWIGIFWKRGSERGFDSENIDIWICLIPMVPIHLMRRNVYFGPGEKP